VTETLDRILYGVPFVSGEAVTTLHVLATSGLLGAEDARQWQQGVWLSPLPESEAAESRAVGLFEGPGRHLILARVENQRAGQATPLYEYVALPRKLLIEASPMLSQLIDLLTEPFPPFDLSEIPQIIPPLNVPEAFLDGAGAEQNAHAALQAAIRLTGHIDHLLAMTGAALSPEGVVIQGFPPDLPSRLQLIQGILLLLPPCARPALTFATSVTGKADTGEAVRVVFAEHLPTGARWTVDFAQQLYPFEAAFNLPYIQRLHERWNGDESALLKTVNGMNPLAETLFEQHTDFYAGLDALAAQLRLNDLVRAGEPVPAEDLTHTLTADLPLSASLREAYARALLMWALQNRDQAASLVVAHQMDRDPVLDAALGEQLLQELETQPDAVYAFVRTRLNDSLEENSPWLPRLAAAAERSVQVAISDADPATVVSWLQLIAREPSAYQLAQVLCDSLLLAEPRAVEDAELARLLLTVAIKRECRLLAHFLNNKALLAALPPDMAAVFYDYAGDPLALLHQRGPEIFTVAMSCSTQAHASQHFSPAVINEIWKFYTAEQHFNLPEPYQPQHIVDMWLDYGAEWLPSDALETLLALMLADGRDTLFFVLTERLRGLDLLLPLLPGAIQNSQRSIDDVLAVVGHLLSTGQLSQNDAITTYTGLLDLREWRQTAFPLVEQTARMIQHSPNLLLREPLLWNMLDTAAKARSDMVGRVAARQLFMLITQAAPDSEPDDSLLTEGLVHLIEQVQWSAATEQHVLNWWRDFVRGQTLVRLVRLDKAFEGKRQLEDARVILQTTLAFRRMMGNRSMAQFAQDLNTTFSMLEDIAEAFDPQPKRAVSFDHETVRSELDSHEGALSKEKLSILAKDLMELARLVGDMGDNRSKAGMMRREENIDRQLMTGEQQPESAVDVMKWIAGYLEGMQNTGNKADK
jgi:hypothetical protein